jgi:hypothetical protein
MAQGAAALMMRRNDYRADLLVLAELIADEFGVSRLQIANVRPSRHDRVVEARRFFCLFANTVHGTPYYKLSHFLRLSKDGARMLAQGLLVGEAFGDEHKVVWARVETKFEAYLAEATKPVAVGIATMEEETHE